MEAQRPLTKANLFIIGAPKCGTTSVYAWLSTHADVFMCEPKEPHFFSSDVAGPRAAASVSEYQALFAAAGPNHRWVGEASTTYLRSQEAVPAIEAYSPGAHYIVALRSPIEMAASVHQQLCRSGREPVTDFAEAWALQAARARGEALPTWCPAPDDLQYGAMCSLGAQLQRLLDRVPAERVHLVFLEDIRSDARKASADLFAFLGIADSDDIDLSEKNAGRMPRSPAVAEWLSRLHAFKRRLGVGSSLGLGGRLKKINEQVAGPAQRVSAPDLRAELAAYFASDVALLGRLSGRDLSGWLA